MLPSSLRSLFSSKANEDSSRSPPRRILLSTPPDASSKDLPPGLTTSAPLPPYLTGKPLLFLTLLSPPVLALLLALFTLILLATQATDSVASAKREILAGCRAAEKAAAVLDHVPTLMKQESEKALKKAVEAGVEGVGIVLMLAITIVQNVLEFLIDTFRSVYLCCLELLVFGALAILIAAVEEISEAVKATLNGIRNLIRGEVSSANSLLQDAVSGINKVTGVFGIDSFTLSNFSVPGLSSLENVTISTKFEGELKRLNTSLPTLNELREKLNSFIDEPCDAMVTKINSTTSNFTFMPSSSTNLTATSLPVSSSSSDSLCSDLDLSFVDEIGHDLQKIKSWGIGLLVVVILIAIAVLLYLETLRYRSLVERVRLHRASRDEQEHFNEQGVMEVIEVSQMSNVGVWMWREIEGWKRLGEGSTRRGKWLVSLILHPMALAPLLIGSIGLITIWFQLAAVNALEHKANMLSSSSVDDMSNSLAAALNARLLSSGQEWATDVNRQIAETQKMLDNDLFGDWVNTTTVVLNTTLVEFYALVTEAVNVTFGDTVLEAPVSTFLYCMIGSKVVALEKALTWIHDNSHFILPTISDSVFAISNDTTSALVKPIATAAVASGDDDDGGVLQRLIEHYKKGLRNAQIVHAVFVSLWVLVVLGGIVTVVLDAKRERRELEGRPPMRDIKDVIGSWPVFKVLGRPKRQLDDNDWDDKPKTFSQTDEIGLMVEAFAPPLHRDLSPTSPSHHHLTAPQAPRPVSRTPNDRLNSYFEFDGGAETASPYPFALRSTLLLPTTGREPRSFLPGWKERLRGRISTLASTLNRPAPSAVALTDDTDESAARRFAVDRRSLVHNPFTDDPNLPIAQEHSSSTYHLSSSNLPPPPKRYAVNASPYHAIDSPSDRAFESTSTPIHAAFQRRENPFGDEQATGGAEVGRDPSKSSFDDPKV